MPIDCKKIACQLDSLIIQKIKEAKKSKGRNPKLVVISVNPKVDSMLFLLNKEKKAKKLGFSFEKKIFKKTPSYSDFIYILKEYSNNPKVDGIIIQLPIPPSLKTYSFFEILPDKKEVEGFKKNSPYLPPVGMAVITMLKYIYNKEDIINIKTLIPNPKQDAKIVKEMLFRKNIVLLGRGETGGKPCAKILSLYKIPFIQLTSSTYKPEKFTREADIIISAVGKTIINSNMIKKGAILIGVGLHKEENIWVGDYFEKEIEEKASHYTPTPGGIGPLNVSFLFYNTMLSFIS